MFDPNRWPCGIKLEFVEPIRLFFGLPTYEERSMLMITLSEIDDLPVAGAEHGS